MELHIDGSGGVSGDRLLAALLHLRTGPRRLPDCSSLEAALAAAGLPCALELRPAEDGGSLALRLRPGAERGPSLSAAGLVRALRAVLSRCAEGEMPPGCREEQGAAVLDALAGAESACSGRERRELRVPQARATRLVACIAAICRELARLKISRVTLSPLCWHPGDDAGASAGEAARTALLLRGCAVRPGPETTKDAPRAVTTPLGAALVRILADAVSNGPEGILAAYGCGSGEDGAAPLRLCLARPAALASPTRGGREQVVQLETHLDHLSGEELGLALTALSGMACILDALWLPGIGKKNRPAGLLRVLCRTSDEAEAATAVFRHTHTLGLRRQTLERAVLPRGATAVLLDGEPVAAKAYRLEGRDYVRPEAVALCDLAARRGVGAPALRFGREGSGSPGGARRRPQRPVRSCAGTSTRPRLRRPR